MNQKTAQKIIAETKIAFNEVAEEFSLTRGKIWPIMKKLAKIIKEKDNILDVGCGNGRLYELLKEKNVFYFGIDNSEKLIEIAKKKFQIPSTKFQENPKFQIQNSKPQFLVANVLDLPFRDEKFDKVFMFAVLPHIPSQKFRKRVLRNIWQILKKDGFLILTCWHLWQPKLLNRYHLWSMILGCRPKGLDWKDTFIPWQMKNGQKVFRYYHAFTKKELKKLLKRTDFQVLEIYYEKKGQKTNFWQGDNLVIVAKKY